MSMLSFGTRVIGGPRTKYLVVAFWLAVIVIMVPLAARLSGAERNDTQAWLPGSAESTKVLDRMAAFQSPNLMQAVVVFERSGGITGSDKAVIASDARRLSRVGHQDGPVSGPEFSADGKAAVVVVPLDLGPNGWKLASSVVDRMTALTRGDPGLQTHITGPAGYAAASAKAFNGIDGVLLLGTVLIVIVILLVCYRSPVLWLFPVASAGVALVVAEGIIYLLAGYGGLTVNALSVGILTVLVFGAGTDYALLLVARYREELRHTEDRHVAMGVALTRAGPAVIASASTVILGLLCLSFAETNSTKSLGPVAAIGVAVALLAMLTLLPALLVVFGRRMFWPFVPRNGSAEPTLDGPWARMGRRIARRPRPVWILTALLLGVLALGITSLHADGLTNAQAYRGHPAAVQGEQVVAEHFPAGVGSPVIVIADAAGASTADHILANTAGIASVTAPLVRHGETYLQGTLVSPSDSTAASNVIERLRAEYQRSPQLGALVGGTTAVNLDVERAATHDRNLIIPIVLVVVFAILALLLRALIAPLLLMATVVLSLLATLGVSSFVFTHVFGFAGEDAAMPLYIFVFLVALGIDYNIFLMSRVREESKRSGTLFGAITALGATGGVITAAGFVLAGTFAVLSTLPLTTFTEVGFAVAFGVLLDTVIVRSVLVTALNLELGDRVWWPSRLSHGPSAEQVQDELGTIPSSHR